MLFEQVVIVGYGFSLLTIGTLLGDAGHDKTSRVPNFLLSMLALVPLAGYLGCIVLILFILHDANRSSTRITIPKFRSNEKLPATLTALLDKIINSGAYEFTGVSAVNNALEIHISDKVVRVKGKTFNTTAYAKFIKTLIKKEEEKLYGQMLSLVDQTKGA